MMGIVLVVHLLYMFHWGLMGLMSERQYFYLFMSELTVVSFISGWLGLKNKKKITDKMANMFSEQLFVGSIIMAVFLVSFWLKWH